MTLTQNPIESGNLAAKTRQALSVYGLLLPAQVKALINDLAAAVDQLRAEVTDLKENRNA